MAHVSLMVNAGLKNKIGLGGLECFDPYHLG